MGPTEHEQCRHARRRGRGPPRVQGSELGISCLVVTLDSLDVFQSDNDRFGRQSVPNCISPRPPFASFSFRTSAPERIGAIGFDLSKRGHWLVQPSAFLQVELPASPGSRLVPLGLGGTLPLRLQTQLDASTDRDGRAIDPRVLP